MSEHKILEEYNLTSLDINWEHLDVSTYSHPDEIPTGRIRIKARRGPDEVSFTRYTTAEEAVALAAKALDALR